MSDEVLQEKNETVSYNEVLVPDQQEDSSVGEEIILEVEENSSDLLEDELFSKESVSVNQPEIIEQDYEILVPLDSDGISGNSISSNSIPNEDFPVYENIVYAVGDPVSPGTFFTTSINELSSTDTLLFLIFCILLVNFIHNIFKGSHFLRRIR